MSFFTQESSTAECDILRIIVYSFNQGGIIVNAIPMPNLKIEEKRPNYVPKRLFTRRHRYRYHMQPTDQ
jgi:hypothetical protein